MQENSSNQKTAKKISDARQQSLNKPDKLTTNDNQQSNLSTKSITQKSSTSTENSTEKKKKKSRRGKSKKNKHLTIHSRTLTLALKFYPEQMMNKQVRQSITNPKTGRIDYSLWTDGDLLDQAKAYLNDRIKNFSTYFNSFKSPQDKSKRHWEVEAICHDRDEVANPDDMFAPAIVKPHFHVIIRDANNKRFFVETILKALGLNYQKEDSELFYEHGCTTVADFNAYSVYLTHETEQAKKDGKELYDLSEVMTNMPLDELKDIRAGYSRLQSKSKLSDHDWNELADYASKLGDELGDFDAWSKSVLTFAQRTGQKFKALQDEFNKHLTDSVDDSPDLTRCCILISGNANDGKSWTTTHALQNLGEKIYPARSSSGKYDGLQSTATAMTFDDRMITDALNVTDNRAVVLHGRGTGGDKAWLGRYVVVTTNLPIGDFFSNQVRFDSQIDAIRSRFYTCILVYDNFGHGHLEVVDASTRGTAKDIQARNDLFTRFADEFNKLITNYHPLSADDAPKLDAKYYQHAPEQSWEPKQTAQLIAQLETENNSLRNEALGLSSKLGDVIRVLRNEYPSIHNNVYFTGDLDTPYRYGYKSFLEFLRKANPNDIVYKEDSYTEHWTVSELLSKLPAPNIGEDNYILSDCQFIRIEPAN